MLVEQIRNEIQLHMLETTCLGGFNVNRHEAAHEQDRKPTVTTLAHIVSSNCDTIVVKPHNVGSLSLRDFN